MKTEELPIKEQIIKTTKELLILKGNITIKEIADAAFVNVAAINYHFGTKDNLVTIVIEQVVSELRNKIMQEIKQVESSEANFELIFMQMIEIIFKFSEANVGIVKYAFLQMATQSEATNILIDFFILDNEFISMVLGQLALLNPGASHEALFSKYLILFSSFIVPFFISFSGTYPFFIKGEFKDKENFFDTYRNEYFKELRKLLVS